MSKDILYSDSPISRILTAISADVPADAPGPGKFATRVIIGDLKAVINKHINEIAKAADQPSQPAIEHDSTDTFIPANKSSSTTLSTDTTSDTAPRTELSQTAIQDLMNAVQTASKRLQASQIAPETADIMAASKMRELLLDAIEKPKAYGEGTGAVR